MLCSPCASMCAHTKLVPTGTRCKLESRSGSSTTIECGAFPGSASTHSPRPTAVARAATLIASATESTIFLAYLASRAVESMTRVVASITRLASASSRPAHVARFNSSKCSICDTRARTASTSVKWARSRSSVGSTPMHHSVNSRSSSDSDCTSDIVVLFSLTHLRRSAAPLPSGAGPEQLAREPRRHRCAPPAPTRCYSIRMPEGLP